MLLALADFCQASVISLCLSLLSWVKYKGEMVSPAEGAMITMTVDKEDRGHRAVLVHVKNNAPLMLSLALLLLIYSPAETEFLLYLSSIFALVILEIVCVILFVSRVLSRKKIVFTLILTLLIIPASAINFFRGSFLYSVLITESTWNFIRSISDSGHDTAHDPFYIKNLPWGSNLSGGECIDALLYSRHLNSSEIESAVQLDNFGGSPEDDVHNKSIHYLLVVEVRPKYFSVVGCGQG